MSLKRVFTLFSRELLRGAGAGKIAGHGQRCCDRGGQCDKAFDRKPFHSLLPLSSVCFRADTARLHQNVTQCQTKDARRKMPDESGWDGAPREPVARAGPSRLRRPTPAE